MVVAEQRMCSTSSVPPEDGARSRTETGDGRVRDDSPPKCEVPRTDGDARGDEVGGRGAGEEPSSSDSFPEEKGKEQEEAWVLLNDTRKLCSMRRECN